MTEALQDHIAQVIARTPALPALVETLGSIQPRATPPWLRYETAFTGAWILDEDPLKIGPTNFADLQNWRYTNSGLEGVQGYARLTTSALARPLLRNGIHLLKGIAGLSTSFLLVQAWAAAFASSALYQHLAPITVAGNFETTPLWTDSAGAGVGRFTLGPDGVVAYANGVDTLLWGSPEHRVAAVVNYDDGGGTFRYDQTLRLQNTQSGGATLVRDASSDIWLLIGATRPLQGIKLYVATPNASAATTTVEYWAGTSWSTVGGFSDGTAVAGKTLAQTGTLGFTATTAVAYVKFEDERLLYFYRVKIGATGTPDAGIQLAAVTVDAPFQRIVDVWDGIERAPIMCQVNSKDFSLEILEPSSSAAPIAAELKNLTAGNAVILGFEERITALQLRMIPDAVNLAATVLTVKYWNGNSWVSVGATDGTAVGGVSLKVSGAVTWTAPAATSEFQQTLFGRTGYYYQLTWSVTLTNADIFLDTVVGIPAQRWNAQTPITGYRFPFAFAGRIMVAGNVGTNELNRVDYCAVQRPDVWNGDQASDQGKHIYIGDQAALTSAVELSNRFAGNLTAICLAHKASETWLLQGNSPDNFTTFRVSQDVGNPAPLSLAVAEIPFTVDNQAIRTVALWCSAKGPMMSEGSVLVPMRFPQPDGVVSSIDAYFHPADARMVNPAGFPNIRGWYDPQWSEYNLLVPSGAGQYTCNTWLVCDLRHRKWYRKVPVAFPQMIVPVEDSSGATHIYAGVDTGHLLQLEYGTTWDGAAITHSLDSADSPYAASMWDETRARYFRLGAVSEGVAAAIVCAHARNGSGTFVTQGTLALAASGRYQQLTQPINLTAFSHQWRLTCSTTALQRAPRLLAYGVLYLLEREILSDGP